MTFFQLSKAEALKALLRRLPETYSDRKYLEIELHNTEAGVRGEQRLQKKFVEYYTEEPYQVLWNVSLALGNWNVQIDALLLTARAAVVIESKNISGDLYFDHETGEFYRIDSQGIKTVMDNPAIQVEKHMRFLKAWFKQQSIDLPLDGLLVFTAKQAELKTLPLTVFTCKLHQMIEKLFKILAVYQTPLTSNRSLESIKCLIENNQTPYKPKPLILHYNISPNQFINGIYCLHCQVPTVRQFGRRWICEKCSVSQPEALLATVREYFAFFGGPATNKKLRDFSGISNRHIIKRLLAKDELKAIGRKRHRQYFIE